MNAILIWLLIQPLKLAAMLAAWLLAWPAAAISMRRPANDPLPPWLRVNLGYKDSGTHDRVLPVLHINPFRGLLT